MYVFYDEEFLMGELMVDELVLVHIDHYGGLWVSISRPTGASTTAHGLGGLFLEFPFHELDRLLIPDFLTPERHNTRNGCIDKLNMMISEHCHDNWIDIA